MRDFLELWCYRERKFGHSEGGKRIRELIVAQGREAQPHTHRI